MRDLNGLLVSKMGRKKEKKTEVVTMKDVNRGDPASLLLICVEIVPFHMIHKFSRVQVYKESDLPSVQLLKVVQLKWKTEKSKRVS